MRTATGRVAAFDQHAGFGTIEGDDGTELFFHCTAIADGTRIIEVDTEVLFEVVPGHHGRWEAASVRPHRP